MPINSITRMELLAILLHHMITTRVKLCLFTNQKIVRKFKALFLFWLGNTFDVVKYNEDYEIWDTLTKKTNADLYKLNAAVVLRNGQTVNVPMKVISVEDVKEEFPNRFGTGYTIIYISTCL